MRLMTWRALSISPYLPGLNDAPDTLSLDLTAVSAGDSSALAVSKVGLRTVRYCSPRHRMPFDSLHESLFTC
jgi:hypothetical protein